MVASSLKDAEAAIVKVPTARVELLPAALIYGANASGKSNFVSAMSFLQNNVRNSHQHGSPDGGVQRVPFVLDSRMRSAPSKFDIDFTIDGVRFHYGFSVDDKAYLEEWLYTFPSGKQQTWFMREQAKKKISISEKN